MEYFENGDLAQHISSISTEDEVKQIMTDLLEALRIIHAEGFAHRDLKPQVRIHISYFIFGHFIY
jgi:serine/threonine protein kinase